MASVAEILKAGRAEQQAGQVAKAERFYRQVLDAEPNHAEALMSLAMLSLDLGRRDEAIGLLERLVTATPNDPDARGNLGSAYCTVGRYAEGGEQLERAVCLAPDQADAHYNLGLCLQRLGRTHDAVASYQRCLALHPNHCPAQRNLGVIFHESGNLAEAQRCYERARDLEPRQAASYLNLGTVLKDRGKMAEAITCYERALSLEPTNAQAHCSRGTMMLAMGRFAEGLSGYESRIGCPDFNTMNLEGPRWDGRDLAGRTLLVHCEQGLGDTLQFIRYVKFARGRGGKVIVAAQPALIPLLEQSGFGPLVSRNDPLPPFDVHSPLLSLPSILRTRLENIPAEVPYLVADSARVDRWRQELAAQRGLKVGIVWQGQQKFRGDRLRSIPLARFAPVAGVSGVQLVSLQKGPGCEQLAEEADRFAVVDLSRRLDNDGAFLDTAAVMRSLDLVITSDTAAAHLAGGLGVKVWVALGAAPDWRWLLDRQDSPWYPTMRLFRQRTAGDWSGVFADMAAELARMV
jgi:tetratricopeptide (TPR) repeat protein